MNMVISFLNQMKDLTSIAAHIVHQMALPGCQKCKPQLLEFISCHHNVKNCFAFVFCSGKLCNLIDMDFG